MNLTNRLFKQLFAKSIFAVNIDLDKDDTNLKKYFYKAIIKTAEQIGDDIFDEFNKVDDIKTLYKKYNNMQDQKEMLTDLYNVEEFYPNFLSVAKEKYDKTEIYEEFANFVEEDGIYPIRHWWFDKLKEAREKMQTDTESILLDPKIKKGQDVEINIGDTDENIRTKPLVIFNGKVYTEGSRHSAILKNIFKQKNIDEQDISKIESKVPIAYGGIFKNVAFLYDHTFTDEKWKNWTPEEAAKMITQQVSGIKRVYLSPDSHPDTDEDEEIYKVTRLAKLVIKK